MVMVVSLRAASTSVSLYHNLKPTKMAKMGSASSTATPNTERKLPILLFDIMDTVVRDPFYHDVPAFFGMSLKELIECKHPTAWMEFEKGIIDEMELASKFFKDGRHFDLEGLKTCMRSGYSFVEGIEKLLLALKLNNYEMHAFTNYPIWMKNVEAAIEVGIRGIHFKNANALREELSLMGIDITTDGDQ